MGLLKVEGENHLYRDATSRAILNTDNKAAEEYKKRRSARMQQKEEIEQQQTDINNLNDEVKELKEQMRLLLNKLSGN